MSVKCILQGQREQQVPMTMLSNPNLLLNWYFRNPVNRNGKTVYDTGSPSGYYCIDRWLLTNDTIGTIESDGFELNYQTYENIGNYLAMSYIEEDINSLIGKTMTFSLLTSEVSGNSFAIGAQFQPNYIGNTYSANISTPGLVSITFTVPEDAAQLIMIITSKVKQNVTLKCIAAKLELGDKQTLARQNENGEWEIIDPPDYDLQYTLCSQYSPITGKWIGSQHSNPNLLDNWYFAGGGSQQGGGQFPINQKGQTELTLTNNQSYFIDRWLIVRGIASLTENGISLKWSGQSNPNNSATLYTILTQRVERGSLENLIGQRVTLSAIINDNLYSNTIIMPNTDAITTLVAPNIRFGYECRANYLAFSILYYSPNIPIVIKAMKAELGPVQTLAYKEGNEWVLNDPLPNYQQELAKCQRYQFVPSPTGYVNLRCVHIGKNTIYFNFDTPVTMRATPTILNIEDFNLIKYGNVSSNSEDGFTYTTLLHNNSIRINANKEGHGLTDAVLGVYKTCIFDANL